MHILLLLFTLVLFLTGCKCAKNEEPLFKFADGQIICHKLGGPKLVILSHDSMMGKEYYVRSLNLLPNNSVNVAIGGSGLIAGGDGVVGNELFRGQWLREVELTECQE